MSMPTPDPTPVGGPYGAPAPAPRPQVSVDRRVLVLVTLGLLIAVLVALVLFLPDDGGSSGAAATPSPAATPTETTEPTEPTEPEPTPTETAAADQPSAEEQQVQRDAVFAELVRRDPADPTAVGDVDAPVVMVMWADFRCGYCARFAIETAPGLDQYVADGTLRIEWRDFPRVTQESAGIAAAARAAGLQGQFWAYHDRLFADHATVEVMGDDYLRGIATELGLDVARFDADRASAEVQTAVQTDAQEGQAVGVTGTPAFIINGSPIAGAQPLETFVSVIEAELARAAG